MKPKLFILLLLLSLNTFSQISQMVSTTENQPWEYVNTAGETTGKGTADIILNRSAVLQSIEGFGACFNELGWTSLNQLSTSDRNDIMKELFAPGIGANFTICRMPLGANDFSLDWYSYNETEGDFKMRNFSIENDKKTLIPFIQEALEINPVLKIWASPWSPPAWMKYNKHYACAVAPETLGEKYQNQLPANRQGKEGSNMFIQEDAYFKAYALYFGKFIEKYRKEGIQVKMIMPQNEFNSCQIFPSCTWTSQGLATFIGKYLGPEMEKQKVEIMFGTMERPSVAMIDTVLNDAASGKYINGVGFQWAGKEAIKGVHEKYPQLKLYQTEQECGDGKNDWKYCRYAWTLMKHYISNGASAYLYWNISLEEGGISRWGWSQNSLVTVDSKTKTYRYNHEFYLLKHLSHFVQPEAKLLKNTGEYQNLLAFVNPDNSLVIMLQNEGYEEKNVTINIDGKEYSVLLKPDSFTSLVIR